MRAIMFTIGIVICVVPLLIYNIFLAKPPPPNPYGGTNRGSSIEHYYVVKVFDYHGKLKCSYPVNGNLGYAELQKFDCPPDLEPQIFIGD